MTNNELETLEDIDNRYREVSADLLKIIAERDKLGGLLKILSPSEIVQLRTDIAKFDKAIESLESYLEILEKARAARINLENSLLLLQEKIDEIAPQFLAYIAEHQPEKLDEMEIFLNNEDSRKTH